MPIKDERSLIQLDRNMVITLPKGWVNFWNMKKGERLSVYYDSVLVVIPSNHPNREEVERKIRDLPSR